MGLLDAQGFLHLKDRKSDMIITGGYNVYPLEVENALLTHPAVRECVVVGLPHDKWVEVVTAAVALRDGRRPVSRSWLPMWRRSWLRTKSHNR
jgi:acyl-CoA synthetase (AMP-forming)/AMP-acid ligase II